MAVLVAMDPGYLRLPTTQRQREEAAGIWTVDGLPAPVPIRPAGAPWQPGQDFAWDWVGPAGFSGMFVLRLLDDGFRVVWEGPVGCTGVHAPKAAMQRRLESRTAAWWQVEVRVGASTAISEAVPIRYR